MISRKNFIDRDDSSDDSYANNEKNVTVGVFGETLFDLRGKKNKSKVMAKIHFGSLFIKMILKLFRRYSSHRITEVLFARSFPLWKNFVDFKQQPSSISGFVPLQKMKKRTESNAIFGSGERLAISGFRLASNFEAPIQNIQSH